MKLKWNKILVIVFMLNLLKAGEAKFSVSDIYNDPGLSKYGCSDKKFKWLPEGETISYLEEHENNRAILLKMSASDGIVDTIVKSQFLNGLCKTDSILLKTYHWGSLGENILFSSKNGSRYLFNIENLTLEHVIDSTITATDVKFSPDGKHFAYIFEHNMWIYNIGSKKHIQLTNDGNEFLFNGETDWVYPEELDLSSAYQWSSDSRKIAFLQFNEEKVARFPLIDYEKPKPEIQWEFYPKAGEQNPKVRPGVVDIARKKIKWIEIGNGWEYIARLDWLPNRDVLAIQTLNRIQNTLKLHFADVNRGEVDLILTEKDTYWLNITDMYHFFKNKDEFIWYSEKDGFMHLYYYDYKGKMKKQLTGGKWVVTDLNGVDEESGVVYFTANKKSVLERHIYSTTLKKSKISDALDRGEGTHSATFSPSFDYFIDRYSSIDHPVELFLCSRNGEKISALYQNPDYSKEKYGLGDIKFFEIPATDGEKLYGSMLYPQDFDPSQKYPVLVYVYGGPHVQTVQNSYGRIWSQLLAQKGYLVFRLDNRGSFGRGREWERKIYLQFGKCELQDQLQGVEFLKKLEYVDHGRIGIWGWSFGGYMTLTALAEAPDVFKTGIAVAPVTNWKYYDSIYTERYMGLPSDNQLGYFEGSPVNSVANIKNKFLIVHGTGDDNVHFQNSVTFIDELVKYNKKFEMMIYPNRKHGIRDNKARIHLFEKMTEFIENNL